MTTYNAERVPDLLGPQGPLAASLDTYEDRPYQREMTLEVARLLEEGGYLAIEAPTGIGKSLGYALPAALWARAGHRPVMISTHTKALQDQLLHLEAPRLARILGTPVQVEVLKGRANYLCRRRYEDACDLEAGPGTRELLERLRPWVERTEVGDLAECGERDSRDLRFMARRLGSDPRFCAHAGCTPADGCYYKRARARVGHADLVVVNHALLAVHLLEGRDVLPAAEALVVDEAHAFVRVALDHLTVTVNAARIEALKEELGGGGAAPPSIPGLAASRLDAVRRAVIEAEREARLFFAPGRRGGTAPEARRYRDPEELAALLSGAADPLLDRLGTLEADARVLEAGADEREEESGLLSGIARLREETARIREDLSDVLHPDPQARDRVYWKEAGDGAGFSLCASPLTLGARLAQALDPGPPAVVFTSATLAAGEDFTFFSREVGLAERLHAVAYPSPFAFLEQALVLAVRQGPDPRAPQWAEATARALDALLADPGRKTMALFTSYRDLTAVRDLLRGAGDGGKSEAYALVAQQPGVSVAELLEAFRAAPRALLLGTSSFWEGVDLPGDDLEVLVVTRLPFGVPTEPRFEARAERLEAEGGNPFLDLYLPEAVLRFKQGFGRLIRRRTDRGIVAVLDPRLLGKSYGRRFTRVLPVPVTAVPDGDRLVAAAARWWRSAGREGDTT